MHDQSIIEEKIKDIDLSSIDIDSQCYQRKLLELDENLRKKIITEEEFCNREMDLANNYDDEMNRRIRLKQIRNDFDNRMKKLNEMYEKLLNELKEKHKEELESGEFHQEFLYYKKIFRANSKDRIMCGLPYFIKMKKDDFLKIYIYDDVKYSKYIGELSYNSKEEFENDWTDWDC